MGRAYTGPRLEEGRALNRVSRGVVAPSKGVKRLALSKGVKRLALSKGVKRLALSKRRKKASCGCGRKRHLFAVSEGVKPPSALSAAEKGSHLETVEGKWLGRVVAGDGRDWLGIGHWRCMGGK